MKDGGGEQQVDFCGIWRKGILDRGNNQCKDPKPCLSCVGKSLKAQLSWKE